MSLQLLNTRVRARRGRPRLFNAAKDLGTPETRKRLHTHSVEKGLYALWKKGLIPYDLCQSGHRYMTLRSRSLRILQAPKIATCPLEKADSYLRKNTTHSFCIPQTPDERETLLLWQRAEKHLKHWERERISLLIQIHGGDKPLSIEMLTNVGRCLYPLLEDLNHFFQTVFPSKDNPSLRL